MSRKSIIGLIALVVLFFIVQLQMPKKWNWTPTYAATDKNPFGCLLMDSVLKGSLPCGHYKIKHLTLWQLAHSRDSLSNVLWVTETATLDKPTTLTIERMMARGQRLMIVAREMALIANDSTEDSYLWGMTIQEGDRFTVADVLRLRRSHDEMDSIDWVDSVGHVVRQYQVLRPMTNSVIDLAKGAEGRKWEPVIASCGFERGEQNGPYVFAARRQFGRGEMVMVVMPLLFTNYGMIEGETNEVVFRLLDEIADRPIVRISDKQMDDTNAQVEGSPLRLIFRDKKLWWPFYTSLALLVLFFVFTARRRQRAIPVVKPPVNHTLEFTRLIGTLFYQRHDRKGLLRCKWELFAKAVRQQAGVDVQALDDDDRLFQVLSERSGVSYEDVAQLIKRLRYLATNDNDITSKELLKAIDSMNNLASRLGATNNIRE